MSPGFAFFRARRFAPILLLMLVTAVLPSPVLAARIASTSRFTSPQSLVLHARDLPAPFGSGFIESSAPISNAQVAAVEHVSTATIDRHGRLGGYETTFAKHKGTNSVLILDSVGAYRSASDAHWQYEKFLSVTPVPPNSTMIDMHGIGNEARAYLLSIAFGKLHETSVGVYFRRGAYDARIDITELGIVRPADVQALTRILDARLRKAH